MAVQVTGGIEAALIAPWRLIVTWIFIGSFVWDFYTSKVNKTVTHTWQQMDSRLLALPQSTRNSLMVVYATYMLVQHQLCHTWLISFLGSNFG